MHFLRSCLPSNGYTKSCLLWAMCCFLTAKFALSWHAYDIQKHNQMKANRKCVPHYGFNTTLSGRMRRELDEGDLDPDCPCYHEATRPYPKPFVQKLKLWRGMISEFDNQHGESLYGSQFTLEQIYNNQHPANCSEAKFIISGGWPYGFGSRIHMEGLVLSIAMHLGRVYLPHPDGDNIFWETNVPYCRNKKDPTLTCFYEKFSKCTMQDALLGTGGDVNHLRTYFTSDFKASFESEHDHEHTLEQLAHLKSFNLVMTYGGGAYNSARYLPYQIRPILHCSPLQEAMYAYWWRAVTATYIARPNNETHQLLMQLEYKTFNDNDMYGLGSAAKSLNGGNNNKKAAKKSRSRRITSLLSAPATALAAAMGTTGTGNKPATVASTAALRGGSNNTVGSGNSKKIKSFEAKECIAMFVRHGDKGIEMKLIDFIKYYTTAQQLWNGGLVPESSKLLKNKLNSVKGMEHYRNWTEDIVPLPNDHVSQNGTLFITTEDPAVLSEALHLGGVNHWEVVATNLFDRASQTAYKTWDEQHKKGTHAVHDNYEYISMLLNLQIALKCEAWVCTLASNSCRMMDELRATIGAKANRFYADLSIETCSEPPCILDHGHLMKLGAV